MWLLDSVRILLWQCVRLWSRICVSGAWYSIRRNQCSGHIYTWHRFEKRTISLDSLQIHFVKSPSDGIELKMLEGKSWLFCYFCQNFYRAIKVLAKRIQSSTSSNGHLFTLHFGMEFLCKKPWVEVKNHENLYFPWKRLVSTNKTHFQW